MTWNAKFLTGTVIGGLPVVIHENLRLAIIERIQATGRSIPALLNHPVTIGELTVSWFSAFQSEISSLIPLYVNHTDNGGNWNGQSTIQNWTESTIISAIGDASRYSAPTVKQLTDKWIIQQFHIIKLLLWYNRSASTDRNSNIKASGIQPNWSLAESIMASSLPFSSTTDYFMGYGSAPTYFKNYITTTYYSTPSSLIKHDLDVYFYASLSGGGVNTVFEIDFGYTENAFNLYNQYSNINAYLEITPDITAADGSFTEPQLTPRQDREMIANNVRYIEKYNITDGFEYI